MDQHRTAVHFEAKITGQTISRPASTSPSD